MNAHFVQPCFSFFHCSPFSFFHFLCRLLGGMFVVALAYISSIDQWIVGGRVELVLLYRLAGWIRNSAPSRATLPVFEYDARCGNPHIARLSWRCRPIWRLLIFVVRCACCHYYLFHSALFPCFVSLGDFWTCFTHWIPASTCLNCRRLISDTAVWVQWSGSWQASPVFNFRQGRHLSSHIHSEILGQ